MSGVQSVRVSVIVPAYQAAATIDRALASLAAQAVDGGFEVLVSDDGSTDGTPERVRALGDPFRLVTGPHGGPAAARIRGVEAARGELLAFTDADCFPAPGWLAAGAAALERADLVQGAVLPDPSAELGPFDRSIWVTGPSPLFETANLLVRRDLYERIGGFEDWLEVRRGKPLGEDVWLGWRARRAGAHVEFCGDALVHHAVFRRRAAEYVAERRRLVYFPAFARRMPELRRELLAARLFLNRRTAAFDAALAATAAAAALGSPLPLLGALPYAGLLARDARAWRGQRPRVVLAGAAADAVGLAALLRGSVRYRSPVL